MFASGSVQSAPIVEGRNTGERGNTEMHLLLLRSLLREMIADLAGPAAPADESNRGSMTRYLIVVARTEPAVYEHLRNRHLGDPKVRVMLGRRGAVEFETADAAPPVDRRRRRSSLMTGASHELVALAHEVAAETPSPNPQPSAPYEEAPRQMSQIETVDDSQRTTRWLAESQYQLSHVIPSLVEERDRLRREPEWAGRRVVSTIGRRAGGVSSVPWPVGGVSRMMRTWNERLPVATAAAAPRRRVPSLRSPGPPPS